MIDQPDALSVGACPYPALRNLVDFLDGLFAAVGDALHIELTA